VERRAAGGGKMKFKDPKMEELFTIMMLDFYEFAHSDILDLTPVSWNFIEEKSRSSEKDFIAYVESKLEEKR
jgi:hypothetical protein